jgi:hypothetical protein
MLLSAGAAITPAGTTGYGSGHADNPSTMQVSGSVITTDQSTPFGRIVCVNLFEIVFF